MPTTPLQPRGEEINTNSEALLSLWNLRPVASLILSSFHLLNQFPTWLTQGIFNGKKWSKFGNFLAPKISQITRFLS
jgi:hypothetical protein